MHEPPLTPDGQQAVAGRRARFVAQRDYFLLRMFDCDCCSQCATRLFVFELIDIHVIFFVIPPRLLHIML